MSASVSNTRNNQSDVIAAYNNLNSNERTSESITRNSERETNNLNDDNVPPPIPFAAGVKTTSAPNALSKTRRSILMLSGMVSLSEYPLEAATMASPIPVLPLVGSTKMDLPGVMSPRFSASVIMLNAIRSLTELAGLDDSSLQTISATQPSLTLLSLTIGVLPMRSRMFSAILAFNDDTVRDVVTERGTKALLEAVKARRRTALKENMMVILVMIVPGKRRFRTDSL